MNCDAYVIQQLHKWKTAEFEEEYECSQICMRVYTKPVCVCGTQPMMCCVMRYI
jgi:hypothetical protein